MLQLFLISSIFAFLGYWKPRAWALVVPFVVWLAIARLGDLGILPVTTTTDAAISAGVVGAAFALLGFLLSAGKPRLGTAASSGPPSAATASSGRALAVSDAGPDASSPDDPPAIAHDQGPDGRPEVPRTSRRKSTKAG